MAGSAGDVAGISVVPIVAVSIPVVAVVSIPVAVIPVICLYPWLRKPGVRGICVFISVSIGIAVSVALGTEIIDETESGDS